METGEHIHWFLTGRCNSECSYCFGPDDSGTESSKRLETLAKILVENKVKQVTLGGGEPTLVRALGKVLEILKEGSVYISLHTNGHLLNQKKLKEYRGLVDDICLPLDSLDEKIQIKLRSSEFRPVFKKIFDLVEAIQEKGIRVGYHTVFTGVNYNEIPEIYQQIKKRPFVYWRIYEFNEDLARMKMIKNKASWKKWQEWEILRGLGTPEKGYTDGLLAHFLLTEKQMARYKDQSIQFVGRRDEKPLYAFLKNSGDVFFYHWFSGSERRRLGNVLQDGFSFVIKKLKEVEEKGMDFDDTAMDEWVEATSDRPVWTRLYDGNYFTEEIEEIEKPFIALTRKLARLYLKREEKMGRL